MAFKETKRKGFNFFRSYYDVYNELESNKDKVEFIDALLDRQFLGIKPLELKGMAKFAYISQTNSIDSQVKGYEDKTGIILTPCQGGSVGGAHTPSLQVQVQVEGKEQVQVKVKEGLIFPFDSIEFKETWKMWKEYKKDEHKFNYKSIISEQAALKSLSDDSNCDEQTAIKIIMKSIENGWKGFFKIQNNGKQKGYNKQAIDREQLKEFTRR